MRERLKGIKERFMEHEYDFNLKKEDIEWLMEQAERVEELRICNMNKILDYIDKNLMGHFARNVVTKYEEKRRKTF